MAPLTDVVVPRALQVLTDNVLGVVTAALLWLAITVAGVLACVLSPYVLMVPALLVIGGIYGTEEPPPLVLAGVIIPSMALYMVVFFSVLGVLIPAVSGSLYRSIDAALAGRAPLRWTAPISTLRTNLRGVVLTNLLVSGLIAGGLLLLVVPGILAAVATVFAIPAAAVDGLPPMDAVRRSVSHFRANTAFHLGVVGATVVVALLSSMIPLLGSALSTVVMMVFLLVAYRTSFPAEG